MVLLASLQSVTLNLVQIGLKLVNLLKLIQNGTNMLKLVQMMVQIFFNLFKIKFVQNGSNLSKLGQAYPNWFDY